MKFIEKKQFNQFNKLTLDKVFVDLYENRIKMEDEVSSPTSAHKSVLNT